MRRLVIEVLSAPRCRFLTVAIERVRAALALREAEPDVEVRIRVVDSVEDAHKRGFRGSPSVRVDGDDVEARPAGVAPIGLFGRGYVDAGRVERAPSVASIVRALDRARQRIEIPMGPSAR
jgi:hypothetical protein